MTAEFGFPKFPEAETQKNESDKPVHLVLSHPRPDELNYKSLDQKPIHCDSSHCGLPAVTSVEYRFYCIGHFISYCYERLAECAKVPAGVADEKPAQSVDRFLQECAQQAANLVDPIRGLDNLERARLFDIFLWAAEQSAKRNVFAKPEVLDTAYRINRRNA